MAWLYGPMGAGALVVFILLGIVVYFLANYVFARVHKMNFSNNLVDRNLHLRREDLASRQLRLVYVQSLSLPVGPHQPCCGETK